MASFLEDNWSLVGDHFVAKIAIDDNLPGGLIAVNRDPRKRRNKPDLYIGLVEQIGSGCEIVKPGQKVVFERFDYLQYDVDEERIIAREVDIVIQADDTPAPGILVIKQFNRREEMSKVKNLFIPDKSLSDEPDDPYYYGIVTHSKYNGIKPGNFVWARRMERNQWKLGSNLIVMKPGDEMILMVGEKVPDKMPVELKLA